MTARAARASRAPRRGRPRARGCRRGPRPTPLAAVELRVALLDEGVARLLGVGLRVELQGEALLEAVALLHVEELDAVEATPWPRARPSGSWWRSCRPAPIAASRSFSRSAPPLEQASQAEGLGRVDRLAGEQHASRLLHAEHAHGVGGRAHGAAVDLGQAEGGAPPRRCTKSAGAGDADAAAQAVAVHPRDHRHRAVVEVAEGVVAAAVRVDDQCAVLGQLLHVDAALEPAPVRTHHQDTHALVLAEAADLTREVGPALGGERVHRRIVDHQLGDTVLVNLAAKCH